MTAAGWAGWPPGHYYSPIPSPDDIERAIAIREATDPTAIPGLDLRLDAQWAYLEEACGSLESAAPRRYERDSRMFVPVDALIYQSVISCERPSDIVEVGIGHSTASALDAIEQLGLPTRVTAIDPDPVRIGPWAEEDVAAGRLRVVQGIAQDIPPEAIEDLGPNDILFIDSSHVGKAGSDVLHELFALLPATRPGVVIHVHDIYPPFEYSQHWLVDEKRYWNEAYLVRAFLMYNAAFEVLVWPRLLSSLDPDRFRSLTDHDVGGGSLWLRRTG